MPEDVITANLNISQAHVHRQIVHFLEEAGYKVSEPDDASLRYVDLLATVVDDGKVHLYAISGHYDIDIELAKDVSSRITEYLISNHRLAAHVFEYWIVAFHFRGNLRRQLVLPDRTRLMTFLQFQRLLKAGGLPKQNRRSKNKGLIVQNITTNRLSILLLSETMLVALDERIARLKEPGPNSDEAIAAAKKELDLYLKFKKQLEQFRFALQHLQGGSKQRTAAIGLSRTFAQRVSKWWDKDSEAICSSTARMSLFGMGLTVAYLTGQAGDMSVMISGVIAGGKPIADVLRSMKDEKTKRS
jgi:hypothetical protein